MRTRYLYAVCMKETGAFCSGVSCSPVTGQYRNYLGVHRTRKAAIKDCPAYAEVVMFREVRK